jgi:predicted enzyme related to lactoylglutathione lyase
MHKSRLGGFIIDCRCDDLDAAARFWSEALGLQQRPAEEQDDEKYVTLEPGPGGLDVEVQKVSHESRVHIDIESDDKEAEAKRLEALGAKRVQDFPRWIVMEAPTGQRFCIVGPQTPDFERDAKVWPD